MKRLCTICARGGSKGVKNKNLKMINSIPLITYTIGQAKKSGLFDTIAVSSDSSEILAVAAKEGVKILIPRPEELSTDTAAKLPVIVHAAREAEAATQIQYTTFVDLDCTSPLRTVDDIIGAVKLLESENASNVITGSPARRSPYFNLVEQFADGTIGVSKKLDTPLVRRQDSPKCYDMNASIYVWNRKTLFESPTLFQPGTKLFEMPEERSLDIDSDLDFEIVSFLISKRSDL